MGWDGEPALGDWGDRGREGYSMYVDGLVT